jgi:aspartate/methionine/tyrosine aminotransferase
MSDDLLTAVNEALARDQPALWAALSPLGRRVVFPPDIPFQAAQARGKRYNATIGQITDGRGHALALPSLAAGLGALPGPERDRALLYSPVEGIAELRERWRAWQRREAPAGVASTLPIVTAGLTHGLSLVADLFGAEQRALAVPRPFWGNYRQTFATRTGCRVLAGAAYREGHYNPAAIADALADVPAGEPALAILNLPSNPGGYSPTTGERAALRRSLVAAAARRPLVVLCDDAYAGLVYEPDVPTLSPFWELAGAHPNLVPVKVDGATKEQVYFGGRVGFLTFAVDPDSEAARALESKVKCLTRAVLGSPMSTSQVLLLQALRAPTLEDEVAQVRAALAERYRLLRASLAQADAALLRVLPFNSGCFALLELPEELGLTSEQVRLHLLAEHQTGLVSIAPRYLRIAFCSVAAEDLPELVRRIERGIAELAM